MGALSISITVHALSVWLWPTASLSRRPAAPATDPTTVVEIRGGAPAPTAPPLRRPVVVIVGPDPARRGGNPRANAVRSSTRPQPASPVESATPTPSPPDPIAIAVAQDAELSLPSGFVAKDGRSAATPPVTQPSPSDDAIFDELIRAQSARLAAGRGPGTGGFGTGMRGRNGLTLVVGVSGRRVTWSSVAINPVVIQQRPVPCTMPRGKRQAVVRLLVLREGTVAAPRLLESSGQSDFDRCALRYAGGLLFEPGRDRAGRALDVWVHVEIAGSGPEMM